MGEGQADPESIFKGLFWIFCCAGEGVGKEGKGPSYKLLAEIQVGSACLEDNCPCRPKFKRARGYLCCRSFPHGRYVVTLSREQPLGGLGDIHFFTSYISACTLLDSEQVLPF